MSLNALVAQFKELVVYIKINHQAVTSRYFFYICNTNIPQALTSGFYVSQILNIKSSQSSYLDDVYIYIQSR